MFGKKDSQENRVKEPQHIDTLIGAHSVFTGELSFEGAVRIDGRFEGNIHSEKDGTLIVSEGAHIKGEVNVPNLVLHGDINGNVYAGNNLKIGANGILNGDVQYKIITLAEGAAINGRCSRIADNQAPASQAQASPSKQKATKKAGVETIQVK